ncbi:MAG: trmD, partial [Deltaproteobacteria bacterium]|nr:trmD [Deltaproteobacteria bacterium]
MDVRRDAPANETIVLHIYYEMIKFDVLTIFPGMFSSPLSESLLKKALDKGVLEIRIKNLRDYTEDKHRMTDDYPYGGGAGMVMKPEPVIRA